jgi:hypothetical protein
MTRARWQIPIADAKTASVQHRARMLDGIYAASHPIPPEGGRWKVEGGRWKVEVVEGDSLLL